MKQVVIAPLIDLTLRTLGADEARQVHAWFGHLANWDSDPYVRQNAHTLPDVPGVMVLLTNSDIRIFFSICGDTITVHDVAKKQAIMTTAGPSGSR